MKYFGIIFLSVLLLGAIPAWADEWNQRTTVTFSQPVELPGTTLPAGTYLFKLVETSTYRHVVQVTNTREDKVFGTFLAIPDWRLKRTSDTVLHFAERPKGQPEAVRGWFFPGDQAGHEFVYGKRRAAEIAAVEHVAVPAAEVPAPAVAKPAELAEAPVVAITPEKKEVEIAQAAQVEAPRVIAQAAPPPAPPAELPKTASNLPLLAAIGLGVIATGGLLFGIGRVLARS